MFITEDNAREIVDKYGDTVYRFAFILTLSQAGANDVFDKTMFYFGEHDLLDADEEYNKLLLLSQIYKFARKNKLPVMDKTQLEYIYGEKPQEFYDVISLPFSARAKEHLTLYEDYSAEEAAKIIGGKLK